ncbi:MAG: hypothetical protein ACTSPB_17175 [Candidatus Thorarchaeota archaeon]
MPISPRQYTILGKILGRKTAFPLRGNSKCTVTIKGKGVEGFPLRIFDEVKDDFGDRDGLVEEVKDARFTLTLAVPCGLTESFPSLFDARADVPHRVSILLKTGEMLELGEKLPAEIEEEFTEDIKWMMEETPEEVMAHVGATPDTGTGGTIEEELGIVREGLEEKIDSALEKIESGKRKRLTKEERDIVRLLGENPRKLQAMADPKQRAKIEKFLARAKAEA